jgi:ParB family chromosome partitioning protein
VSPSPAAPPPRGAALAHRLSGSQRLRHRRFELLPPVGPGALFSEVQGRTPGESTAPADLVELISSIASVGVLQPVLVEDLGERGRRLVAGERRVRAVLWGVANHPENPHFQTIPAVVCPGPLTEGERRTWQLVENLAREDLQPGELAAALLFERCAVLVSKLADAGVGVPADVDGLDDPVERFRALDRLRVEAGCHAVGAPWPEVLRRLGIQMREEKAKALVRAFSAMPAELSAEMDAAGVALATRLEYLRLGRGGRADAAAELWAAVRRHDRPELLHAVVRERLEDPDVDADDAVARAVAMREAADEARARAQMRNDVEEARRPGRGRRRRRSRRRGGGRRPGGDAGAARRAPGGPAPVPL